jgi:aerobic-type carbon monoxide dehydrogenase small subunit (CoxS/CutS family)
VLREQVGVRSAKDGCSPQGQCGCCTVWVDGSPRVACVTPVRRLGGREVTTLDGLPADVVERWTRALVGCGGSQCGFCTPGIVMRLSALDPGSSDERISRALLAHLCRCTGWQTIVEAARQVVGGHPVAPDDERQADRDADSAAERAALEGGVAQQVGPAVVLGRAGFADDTSPSGALVAVPDPQGGYAVAESVGAARARAGKVQGRSTGLPLVYPLDLPPGSFDLTLRTTYVEPAYVEPDASWCVPGGEPVSPCANGGAFGGKLHSAVATDARRLADEHGRPVRVLWSREDVVCRGPKRPPVAGGVAADGSGVLRVAVPPGGAADAEWPDLVAAVAAVAPGVALEPVPRPGPAVSFDLRGAVWVEAAVLATCAPLATPGRRGPITDVPVAVRAPGGGRAEASCHPDGSIDVIVEAGPVLDEVVLRSYCIGATHQALGWVRSEGIAVDADGRARDLTLRSFGILASRDMPLVRVRVVEGEGPPVNGSDAVFAAAAAAAWLADGLAGEWPTGRGRSGAPSARPSPSAVG